MNHIIFFKSVNNFHIAFRKTGSLVIIRLTGRKTDFK